MPLGKIEVAFDGDSIMLEKLSANVSSGTPMSTHVTQYQALVDQRRNLVNNGDNVAFLMDEQVI